MYQTCKLDEKFQQKRINLDSSGTLVLGHLSSDTLVSKGDGDERTSGWEKKNKTSNKEETSDNIQRMQTYLSIVQNNACHLCSCVT